VRSVCGLVGGHGRHPIGGTAYGRTGESRYPITGSDLRAAHAVAPGAEASPPGSMPGNPVLGTQFEGTCTPTTSRVSSGTEMVAGA